MAQAPSATSSTLQTSPATGQSTHRAKSTLLKYQCVFVTFVFETRFSEYWFVDQKRSEIVTATFPKYPRRIDNLVVSSMLDFSKNIAFSQFFVLSHLSAMLVNTVFKFTRHLHDNTHNEHINAHAVLQHHVGIPSRANTTMKLTTNEKRFAAANPQHQ